MGWKAYVRELEGKGLEVPNVGAERKRDIEAGGVLREEL
jgi:hypothetical protein